MSSFYQIMNQNFSGDEIEEFYGIIDKEGASTERERQERLRSWQQQPYDWAFPKPPEWLQ